MGWKTMAFRAPNTRLVVSASLFSIIGSVINKTWHLLSTYIFWPAILLSVSYVLTHYTLTRTLMKLVLLVPLFTGEDIEAREVSWTPKNTWLGSGGRSDSQTKDLDHTPRCLLELWVRKRTPLPRRWTGRRRECPSSLGVLGEFPGRALGIEGRTRLKSSTCEGPSILRTRQGARANRSSKYWVMGHWAPVDCPSVAEFQYHLRLGLFLEIHWGWASWWGGAGSLGY